MKSLQVTLTYQSFKGLPCKYTLDGRSAKVARLLAEGKTAFSTLAKELYDDDDIREHILGRVATAVDEECNQLCSRSEPHVSLFRHVQTTYLPHFTWTDFIQELQTKAPSLFQIMSRIVSHSDHRNQKKSGNHHYPGICMATAILMKERNMHMIGVQEVLSLVLYAAQVDKLVRLEQHKL